MSLHVRALCVCVCVCLNLCVCVCMVLSRILCVRHQSSDHATRKRAFCNAQSSANANKTFVCLFVCVCDKRDREKQRVAMDVTLTSMVDR